MAIISLSKRIFGAALPSELASGLLVAVAIQAGVLIYGAAGPMAVIEPSTLLTRQVLQGQVLGATAPTLPLVYINTAVSATPVVRTVSVPVGSNLQTAINNAQPGDRLELEPGAVYSGHFTLPNKASGGWVTITTRGFSVPEGTRVGPAHASQMAKIVAPGAAGGPTIDALPGAHHYRFTGVEITTSHATTATIQYALLSLGTGSETTQAQLPNNIIIDRSFVHGTPTGNVRRCIAFNGATLAVVDSYITDCHEVGSDSQAIGGWGGTGPFKIVNNYLAGAGENVMFGGSDPLIANAISSDIEFRRNLVQKPWSWHANDPSYAGIRWSVKNLFELKNAQRVLVDGNIFENHWVDAQSGASILFTVRNQDGGCPWCVVRDVTFTNNIVRHVSAGFNILGVDYNNPSQPTVRLLIKNNLFEDVGRAALGGNSRMAQLPDGGDSYNFDHNTFISDTAGTAAIVWGTKQTNFAYTNNLVVAYWGGFTGDGTAEGNSTLSSFFTAPTFAKNVLLGRSANQYSNFPDNFFPATVSAIGFTNYNSGNGGNYRLLSTSPYKAAGTDGKDIGADIDQIIAAQGSQAVTPPPPTPTPPPPPAPGDTAPPTISLSSPSDGSVVSGVVNISAAASDNVAVVGVQFKVNGVAVGSEDTTTPYAYSWSTTAAVNGSYTVSAVARDAAGNTASAAVSVAVNNTTPVPVNPLTVSPSSLSFNAPIGGSTTAPQMVTLANAGATAVTVSSVSATGDFSVQTNYCMSGVQPSTHCDVYVVFTPTGSGTRTGTVTFAINGGSALTVSLTGVGAEVAPLPTASLAVAPASLSSGQSTTLSWSATNATTVFIDQGIGSVGAVGSKIVAPTTTTTYTITATNNSGSATAQATTQVALPVAAQPSISPSGGSFTASQQISLATTTPGAVIRYTTDGSAPTENSPAYAAPFTLSTSATIRAMASAVGYANSAVASAVFTIIVPQPPVDTTAPIISSVSATSKGVVSWVTNEPTTTQVYYGKTTALGLNSPLVSAPVTTHTVQLSGLSKNTTYYYKVESKDAAGNITTSAVGQFLTKKGPAQVYNLTASAGSVKLVWEAGQSTADTSAAASFGVYRTTTGFLTEPDSQYKIGDTAVASFHDARVQPNTTYFYTVFAFDQEGNYSEPSTVQFTTGSEHKNDSVPTESPKPVPSAVVFPANVQYGDILKFNGSQTVYVVTMAGLQPFADLATYRSYLKVSGKRLKQINRTVVSFTIAPGVATADIVTVEIKSGANFKYANSPTIYFLNAKGQKEAYTSMDIFNAWKSRLDQVLIASDAQTFPDGGFVQPPR